MGRTLIRIDREYKDEKQTLILRAKVKRPA